MNVRCAIRSKAINFAFCTCVFLSVGMRAQSPPPEKAQTGSQAGSSGKEQMGSKGTTESPVRSCDSDTTKKKQSKKKKSKKPDSTKS
jgi:hypothetical protein